MSRTGKRAVGVGGLVAVLASACLGWAVWAVASSERHVGEDARAGDARSGEVNVACREALRFADLERLPAGAEDAVCVLQRGIDTLYDVSFRISRNGLDTWLADTYPDMELDATCVEGDADRCGHLDLHPYAAGGAVAVELTVRDESDGSVLVHFKPFNT